MSKLFKFQTKGVWIIEDALYQPKHDIETIHVPLTPTMKKVIQMTAININSSIVPPIAPGIIIEFGDIMVGIIVCNKVAVTACREK